MSTTGFAARMFGIAVEPTCSMRSASGPSASLSRSRISSNLPAQAGSQATSSTGSGARGRLVLTTKPPPASESLKVGTPDHPLLGVLAVAVHPRGEGDTDEQPFRAHEACSRLAP